MALTPEDIVTKRFQSTKFREGYDQDDVDNFLDEVVVAFRELIAENEELKRNGVSPTSVPSGSSDDDTAEQIRKLQEDLATLQYTVQQMQTGIPRYS